MPVPPSSAFRPADEDDHTAGLLSTKANFPFLFAHYSENWETGVIGKETWWLPALHSFSLEPGCNGVETRQEGQTSEQSYRGALAVQARRGVQIIPTSVLVPVEDEGGNVEHVKGYRTKAECRDPATGHEGLFYTDRWMTSPKAQRPGHRLKYHRDHDGFNRWRRGLVTGGTIAPPVDGVIDERLALCDYHRVRHAAKIELPKDVRDELVEAADKKTATAKDAKVPSATDTTPAPRASWASKTVTELAAAAKLGQLDFILDDVAKDERKGVTDAVKARRKVLKADADAIAKAEAKAKADKGAAA